MSVPGFDDSRIKDYPDKKLLEYIRAYYKPFISGDPDAQKALQTEDFVITDIRTYLHNVCCLLISLLRLTISPLSFSSRFHQDPARPVARHQRLIFHTAYGRPYHGHCALWEFQAGRFLLAGAFDRGHVGG